MYTYKYTFFLCYYVFFSYTASNYAWPPLSNYYLCLFSCCDDNGMKIQSLIHLLDRQQNTIDRQFFFLALSLPLFFYVVHISHFQEVKKHKKIVVKKKTIDHFRSIIIDELKRKIINKNVLPFFLRR